MSLSNWYVPQIFATPVSGGGRALLRIAGGATLGGPVPDSVLLSPIMAETPSDVPAGASSDRRVHPRVALAILEAIRSQDLPSEVMGSEDPAVTMPRRLGLSEVVDRQIDRYRKDARRRQRLTDGELRDLIHLAIRRPDSEDIFFLAGTDLSGSDRSPLRPVLPSSVGYFLARRRVRRRLRHLFGRKLGGFGKGAFTLEGRSLPFIRSDPGGDACAVVSGLCQGVLSRYVRAEPLVVHVSCQSRDDEVCRWKVTAEARASGHRRDRPAKVEGAEAGR